MQILNDEGKQVDHEIIGAAFARLLRNAMTREQFSMMMNRNYAETEENICHSHDFVDANHYMQLALEAHGVTLGDITEEQSKFWNAAWNYAAVNFLGRRVTGE